MKKILKKIVEAFEDYSARRMSTGSIIIGIYFVGLFFYFLWRVISDFY